MRTYSVLCILLFNYSLLSQEDVAHSPEERGSFFAGTGLKFHQPEGLPARSDYIRYGYKGDIRLDFGFLKAVSGGYGWMINIGLSTKNYHYRIKDANGVYNSDSKFGLDDKYYNISPAIVYQVRLSRKFNGMVYTGPGIILNNRGYVADSVNLHNPSFEIVDTKALGVTLDIGLLFSQRISTGRKRILFGFTYQRGFISFMRAIITNPHHNYISRSFYYSGSGPSVRIILQM